MVEKIIKDGETLYRCEECKFIYTTADLAGKCERWCRQNKSCSIEITRYAIKED